MILRPISDLVRRYTALWAGVCWVLVFVMTTFGLAYLIYGIRATNVPSAFAAITRYVPGDMHTYGGLLLVCSAALVATLAPIHRHRRIRHDAAVLRVLAVVTAFTATVVVAFAASWLLTGARTWQAMIYWGSMTALAAMARTWPPDPPDRSRAA